MALKAFSEVKNAQIDFGGIFGFAEEKPLFQIIRLYSNDGKPFAALKIVESDENLKLENSAFQISNFKFQTLAERSAENSAKSRLEILELLSNNC